MTSVKWYLLSSIMLFFAKMGVSPFPLARKNWMSIWNERAVSASGDNDYSLIDGRTSDQESVVVELVSDQISTLLADFNNPFCLDVGVGSGVLNRRILEKAPNINLMVGLDYSLNSLFVCKRNTNSLLVNARVEKLPFNKESFDFIFAYSVCHYLDGYSSFEKMLNLLMQSLRPGGGIFLGDILVARLMTRNRINPSWFIPKEEIINRIARKIGLKAQCVVRDKRIPSSEYRVDFVFYKSEY